MSKMKLIWSPLAIVITRSASAVELCLCQAEPSQWSAPRGEVLICQEGRLLKPQGTDRLVRHRCSAAVWSPRNLAQAAKERSYEADAGNANDGWNFGGGL